MSMEGPYKYSNSNSSVCVCVCTWDINVELADAKP